LGREIEYISHATELKRRDISERMKKERAVLSRGGHRGQLLWEIEVDVLLMRDINRCGAVGIKITWLSPRSKKKCEEEKNVISHSAYSLDGIQWTAWIPTGSGFA
jgi:hypothetical protein